MSEPMTRAAHIEWCKSRALEYVAAGDVYQAWGSFQSDMSKHEETYRHLAVSMGNMMIVNGHLNSVEKMKRFIEGVH